MSPISMPKVQLSFPFPPDWQTAPGDVANVTVGLIVASLYHRINGHVIPAMLISKAMEISITPTGLTAYETTNYLCLLAASQLNK